MLNHVQIDDDQKIEDENFFNFKIVKLISFPGVYLILPELKRLNKPFTRQFDHAFSEFRETIIIIIVVILII